MVRSTSWVVQPSTPIWAGGGLAEGGVRRTQFDVSAADELTEDPCLAQQRTVPRAYRGVADKPALGLHGSADVGAGAHVGELKRRGRCLLGRGE